MSPNHRSGNYRFVMPVLVAVALVANAMASSWAMRTELAGRLAITFVMKDAYTARDANRALAVANAMDPSQRPAYLSALSKVYLQPVSMGKLQRDAEDSKAAMKKAVDAYTGENQATTAAWIGKWAADALVAFLTILLATREFLAKRRRSAERGALPA